MLTMEAKPLQLVPSSHNTTTGTGFIPLSSLFHSSHVFLFLINFVSFYIGGGPQKKIENGEVDEEKRVVVVVKEEIENNPLITEAQRRELGHQVFIFNHFAYNLPLPYYLLQFPSKMSGLSKFLIIPLSIFIGNS